METEEIKKESVEEEIINYFFARGARVGMGELNWVKAKLSSLHSTWVKEKLDRLDRIHQVINEYGDCGYNMQEIKDLLTNFTKE